MKNNNWINKQNPTACILCAEQEAIINHYNLHLIISCSSEKWQKWVSGEIDMQAWDTWLLHSSV